MKLAIVAPSPIPFVVGGAENLWMGMLHHFNQVEGVEAELIKVPVQEHNLAAIGRAYAAFLDLSLNHFDMVISTKYPAWIVQHDDHHVYLQHKLRGLYDTYPSHLPEKIEQWQTLPKVLQLLRPMLEKPASSTEDVAALLAQLEWYSTQVGELDPWLQLPSPLARQVVHWLDAFAFAKQRIKTFAAISHTVAQRQHYFPRPVDQVVYHPSSLQPVMEQVPKFGFFTASRHEEAKRIAMLVQAFMRTQGPWTFRIAGSGPQTRELKALALSDARIQFIGRISDEQLAQEYGRASWTVFAPLEEDYGLISIESMQAGTPVLTTSDSGGVAEVVDHNETGLVVSVDALSSTMQACMTEAQNYQQLSQNCVRWAAAHTWSNLTKQLLADSKWLQPPTPRRHLVVVVPFKVWPPMGGGQQRVYQLYRQVALSHDVTLVSLTSEQDSPPRQQLAPGLTQLCVTKTSAHLRLDRQMVEQIGHSVDDCVMIDSYRQTPQLLTTLGICAVTADLFIASHPYLYYAIKDTWRGPIWYDAHNVEVDMKQAILGASDQAQALLQQVRGVEQACAQNAQLIFTCSQNDSTRLAELFDLNPENMAVAANGVDIEACQFHTASQRQGLQQRLRLQKPVAVFMGAWHGPNIEALHHLISLAEKQQGWDFWIIGSVCRHPSITTHPANMFLFGELDTSYKNALLGAATVALNPIIEGSGTNLKMLEYAALGVPMVSTPFGNRGLGFINKEHATIVDREQFGAELDRLSLTKDSLDAQALKARQLCEKRYAWQFIADTLLRHIK